MQAGRDRRWSTSTSVLDWAYCTQSSKMMWGSWEGEFGYGNDRYWCATQERERYRSQGNRVLKGLVKEITGAVGLVSSSCLMFFLLNAMINRTNKSAFTSWSPAVQRQHCHREAQPIQIRCVSPMLKRQVLQKDECTKSLAHSSAAEPAAGASMSCDNDDSKYPEDFLGGDVW